MKSLFLSFVAVAAITGSAFAQSTAEASQELAYGMFPDLEKEGTSLYAAVQARMESEKKANPTLLNKPNWPLFMAVSEAVKLGIQPVAPTNSDQPEFHSDYRDPVLAAADIKKQREVYLERQARVQTKTEFDSMAPREKIAWALKIRSSPDGITAEDDTRSHIILAGYGGDNPDNRARLTAMLLGASVSDIEAITQTSEMKKQTDELQYQSDRLANIQRNQEQNVYDNQPAVIQNTPVIYRNRGDTVLLPAGQRAIIVTPK